MQGTIIDVELPRYAVARVRRSGRLVKIVESACRELQSPVKLAELHPGDRVKLLVRVNDPYCRAIQIVG